MSPLILVVLIAVVGAVIFAAGAVGAALVAFAVLAFGKNSQLKLAVAENTALHEAMRRPVIANMTDDQVAVLGNMLWEHLWGNMPNKKVN